MTDEQAMWRLQQEDDPEAFTELLRRWEEPVRHLCYRMVGDFHRSQDLAQETFARVFTRRKDFSGGSKFSTWLWTIALNLCRDEQRRRHRAHEEWLEPEIEESLEEPSSGPAAELNRREEADWVRRCVMSLPEHYRTVLILKHYQNLKFAEIATVLGVPEGTVKSRMASALSLLARKLRRSCPGETVDFPRQTEPLTQ